MTCERKSYPIGSRSGCPFLSAGFDEGKKGVLEAGMARSSLPAQAAEQGRATGGGAKGGGQGEREPMPHVPDTVPGKRVTGAGARTEGREASRQTSEVGAVCGQAARTVLCGGAPSNGRPYRNRCLSASDLVWGLSSFGLYGYAAPSTGANVASNSTSRGSTPSIAAGRE